MEPWLYPLLSFTGAIVAMAVVTWWADRHPKRPDMKQRWKDHRGGRDEHLEGD